ncbi:PilT/PilU family type 4a pilus ATPase [Frigoribacterium sp. 2-23]|uniref:type IV pilus twitching motility protein PilT n=1 Tax=Frigoribacterium sp. 2-23 TaxID=3415006 RepID=UPI003C6F1AD5
MSENVYEIPDEVESGGGWTPGTPSSEFATDTPAEPWGLPEPAVLTPVEPESAPSAVYTMDEDTEAVLGWTPTLAPTSRRAARLADALGGNGLPAKTPWSDPHIGGGVADSRAANAALYVPASPPAPTSPTGTVPPARPTSPFVDMAPPASPPSATHPASHPAARPAAPTTLPTAAAAHTGSGFSSAAASLAKGLTPSSPQHVAEERPAYAVPAVESRPGIELHEHAKTVAYPPLIQALCEVVLQGASDLHVTSDAQPTIRVDGALQPALPGEPWDAATVRTALLSLLTPAQQEQFDEVLELDFAYSLSDESRFRVNFYQQRGSIGAAFRLIPTEIKPLHELGVPEVIGRFAKLPRGLVLVTGPTGSGKSTTLAALIDMVNRTRADHIVTVEDPIEFMHQHKKAIVNQREVGSDTHSFANALKHVLRQDPDVILIGELRDLETISVALTAAETGHLVFATLHTQSAAQTIDRVIDVFPPHQQDQVRTQLASTLQGVVCQTLLPKASGKGRVVATEIMMMTPAIGNLVREGKTYQIASAMQAGRDLGMHTLDQKLADLVNTGVVSHKAAMEKVHDAEGFDRLVTRVINTSERQGLDGGIDFGDVFSGGN